MQVQTGDRNTLSGRCRCRCRSNLSRGRLCITDTASIILLSLFSGETKEGAERAVYFFMHKHRIQWGAKKPCRNILPLTTTKVSLRIRRCRVGGTAQTMVVYLDEN